MDERREIDTDTGEISYGGGFSDMFSKLAAKLTGKTASVLASKAAEKLVEKGAEKIVEKTGQLMGEKIYDKFTSKKPVTPVPEPIKNPTMWVSENPTMQPSEIKGKEIGEILRKQSQPPKVQPTIKTTNPTNDNYQYIKDVYNELI